MTARPRRPTTTAEVGGMGHSIKRKEDPRFIRGQGAVHRRRRPPEHALDGHRPQPVRPRDDQVHRRERGPRDAGRARRHHRQGPREGGPALDADARRRQADGAAGRHGHVPGAGGRGGRRDDPLPGGRRDRRGVRRLRAARRWSSTRSRRSSRTRRVLRPDRGPDKANNHIWHWESGDRTATDAALAASDRIVPHRRLHPAHPRRVHRDLRLHRGLRRRQRPASTSTSRSQAPHATGRCISLVSGIPESTIRVKTHDIGGGFGGKVPVYPGYVIAIVASLTLGRPVKWIEDRSENLQADSLRPRLPRPRGARRSRTTAR